MALTPGLIARTYGGKVNDHAQEEGRYVHSEGDSNWWLSGRSFFSPDTNDDPAAERGKAKDLFFLPQRIRDPFHREGFETESTVDYDAYACSSRETHDALDKLSRRRNDYRVFQPRLMTDPNGNRIKSRSNTGLWWLARR